MCQTLMDTQKWRHCLHPGGVYHLVKTNVLFTRDRRPIGIPSQGSSFLEEMEKRLFMWIGFIDPINCEAEEGLVFEECEDDPGPPNYLSYTVTMNWNFFFFFFFFIWNASWIWVSSLRRGHANLLCIVPILVYVLPKRALNWNFWNQKFFGLPVLSPLGWFVCSLVLIVFSMKDDSGQQD